MRLFLMFFGLKKSFYKKHLIKKIFEFVRPRVIILVEKLMPSDEG